MVFGVMSEEFQTRAWSAQLRNAFDEHGFYRINPGYKNPEETGPFWVENDIVSLSDWSLDAHGHPFMDESGVVSFDSVNSEFKDATKREILWDDIRGLIDDIHFEDKDNAISAGKAKGCIKRFVEVFEPGTGLVVNLEDGQAFARVTGECVFDPEREVAVVEPDHVFQRDVEFLRDDAGDVMTFDTEYLPSGLCPVQNSIVEANSRWLLELTQGVEFLTEE